MTIMDDYPNIVDAELPQLGADMGGDIPIGGYVQSSDPQAGAADTGGAEAAGVTMPSAINSQEEWDALPAWQKDLVRMQHQGIQMTQGQAAKYAMDYQQEERSRAAKSERAGGVKLKPSDLMKLSEQKTLSQLAGKAADLIEGLPDGMLGPMDTRWNSAVSATIGGDPKFMHAMTAYESVKNQILKMRSGAAVTENEMARMLKEVGDPTSADSTFKQTLRSFASQTTLGLRDQLHAIKESGYELPESLADLMAGGSPGASPGSQTSPPAAARGTGEFRVAQGVRYEKQTDGTYKRSR